LAAARRSDSLAFSLVVYWLAGSFLAALDGARSGGNWVAMVHIWGQIGITDFASNDE